MRIEPHSLLPKEHFARLKAEFDEANRRRLAALAAGQGDRLETSISLLKFSYWSGCIALILGDPETEILRHCAQAVEAGLQSLGAEASSKRPRVYDATFELSEEGIRTTAIHEIVPKSRAPRRLAIYEFDSVLTTAACFGNSTQIRSAAQFAEDGYRNPEAITGEDYFVYLRGVKRYLLGDQAGAKSDVSAALAAAPNPGVKNEVGLFLAVIEADSRAFMRHLHQRLVDHKKQYQKHPNKPDGVICQQGLMMCRLAIDRGIRVEDGPYLPVRLLPNYRPAVH